MADTILAGRNFDLGFIRDLARDQLPKGAVYRMLDYIPQNEAAARKRGGWAHATADLNAIASSASSRAVGWVPAASDGHLLTVSDTGRIFRTTKFDLAGGSTVVIGGASGLTPTHPPFWHNDREIILQGLGQAAATPIKYYDSGALAYTFANIGGTPPQARAGWSWGSYLALANGYVSAVLFPNRIWYSGVGNSDSWNTTTGYFDMPQEIVAGMQLSTVQIIWGYENTWYLIGDTPPPNGNLARRNLFVGNGCFDARSVAAYRQYAIWANNMGVWQTDGSTLTDLTSAGGISTYWRQLVSTFNFQTGWAAAGGVHRGHYVITITDSLGATVTSLMCDLERKVWTEVSNFNARMYATRTASAGTANADGHEELFFAHRTLPRVEAISGIWTPTAANASDADGTGVLPVIELPFYKLNSDALKRIRAAYITYDIRTSGGSPQLQVGFITSPEATVYTNALPALPTTTKQDRRSVRINRRALGVGLRIAQTAVSADTRLAEIGFEAYPLEPST